MKTEISFWRLAAGFAAATLSLLPSSALCNSDAYSSVVTGDGALGYYRFNDSLSRTLINVNSGSLGAAGNASNDLAAVTFGVVHSIPGAIPGVPSRREFFALTR